ASDGATALSSTGSCLAQASNATNANIGNKAANLHMASSTPFQRLGSAIDMLSQIAADASAGMANICLNRSRDVPWGADDPAFGGGCKMVDVKTAKALV